MRPRDKKRGQLLDAQLLGIDRNIVELPGIRATTERAVLVEQLIESIRRIEYAHFIRDEKFDARRADPSCDIFDPLRAAVFWMRKGDVDEACWLIFLFVHFGKHSKDGWRLVRDIYGALGGQPWTWQHITADPKAFRRWLTANEQSLRSDGVLRRFGNHRKYESLKANSSSGTAAAIESYIAWISPPRTHQQLIGDVHKKIGQNPRDVFDNLYRSMDAVLRFGRLAKFDYLTMLGKLGLAPIEPGSAYMVGATGPLRGARLLFAGNIDADWKAKQLDALLLKVDASLNVGMQVLEDALCNWQKSPAKFISFRG